MIGLDTNIVIRYLVKDDIKQYTRAEKLILSAIKNRSMLHITLVVLCEIVWVLRYTYELERKEIVQFLATLLHAEQVEIENRQLALNAFTEFQNSQADFADCLIGLTNESIGCTTTYTFDKKAGKLALFTKL